MEYFLCGPRAGIERGDFVFEVVVVGRRVPYYSADRVGFRAVYACREGGVYQVVRVGRDSGVMVFLCFSEFMVIAV